MAGPVIRPASRKKANVASGSADSGDTDSFAFGAQLKRKEDDDDYEGSMGEGSGGEEDFSGAQLNKKAEEGVVSKRTLQNRKAQREFRKRREARVRELEERCRRYDQMGLEANSELQRVARGLKEENFALRGFIVRIGMGHVIPSLLQEGGMNAGHAGRRDGDEGEEQQQRQQAHQQRHDGNAAREMGSMPGFFQSSPTFGDFNASTIGAASGSGQFGEPTFFIDPTEQNVNANGRNRNTPFVNGPRSSVTDGNLDKIASATSSATLAPTPSGSSLMGSSQQSNSTPRQIEKKDSHSSHSSSGSGEATSDTPYLSLSLGSGSQQRLSRQTPRSDALRHSNAQNMESLFQQDGNPTMIGNNLVNPTLSGSAFAPFPLSTKPSQQNTALLNPNPIPFSFNLSGGADASSIQPTWWEQMGGGMDGVELDDKAQAVAHAQASGSQHAQSPFDLNAFLQGGLTPNGGFQLGHMGSSQGGEQGKSTPLGVTSAEGIKTADNGSDTEHMRLFVQLMERKMAERDARTYASLGFQPPSQDPSQRRDEERRAKADGSAPFTITMSGQMTPSGVYSRLAQHPAFLSTNARELEELVDALGPSGWNDKAADANRLKKGAQAAGKSESISLPHSVDSQRSPAGHTGSLHVDESAIGKMLGLLDQKGSGTKIKGLTSEEARPALTMALS